MCVWILRHYILCCQGESRLPGADLAGPALPIAGRSGSPYARGVKSRPVARIGNVLADLVQRLELRERLREHEVWNVWSEVVGDLLASKAEPSRIEDGKLFVRVSNSTWMQELQYLKDDVKKRLNQRLGAPVVRDIFLVLGSARRRRPNPAAAKLHPVDETAIAALIPSLGKPELEASLRRLARARARRLGPDGSRA